MSRIVAALRRHAGSHPDRLALQDETVNLSYRELLLEVERLAERLRAASPHAMALYADNGCDWALADLAALAAGMPIIPLPLFFSTEQMWHAIRSAGIDQILTDDPRRIETILGQSGLSMEPFHGVLWRVSLEVGTSRDRALPDGVSKVTFTSGTTGEPKGVCLDLDEMEGVAESLRVGCDARDDDRHLCLLPLATLLENIGGLYTPLLTGATVCLPRLALVGLTGSSGLDVARMLAALGEWRASSAIMVPQMLQATLLACQAGAPAPRGLRYLAVGGAPVSIRLLEQAHSLGLPVHEGYGLSECASVVAVNRPGDNRLGSVGKPLPHVRIAFAEDGEILVRKPRWLGYLGDARETALESLIATGDLGYQDEAGYLYLTGRKKNIYITAFGRNVAPEWVERELVSRYPILQAAVFGEARPYSSAVIVAHPKATHAEISAALDAANRQLPDYAQVRAWIPAKAPFTSRNGMSTTNGRPRRHNILGMHAEQINALYQP